MQRILDFSDQKQRFAIAPLPVGDSHPIVPIIAHSLDILALRQHRDGSWGRGSALDRLICTCHVTMALQAGGMSLSDPVLEKARQWLCHPSIERHNNSYWILGPLAPWYTELSDVKPILERELEKLCNVIDSGAQPHPDQRIEYFYLRIIERLYDLRDNYLIEKYVSSLKELWSYDYGWSGRPDTTSVCYGVLRVFDPDFANTVKDRVIQLINGWASHPEQKYTMWLNPISTSYTLMNIIEAPDLLEDERLYNEANNARQWLISCRASDGMWESNIPYGGTGDIKSRDYPTAAVVRGLLAHASLDRNSIQSSVLAFQVKNLQNRLARRSIIILSFLTIFFFAAIYYLFSIIKVIANINIGIDILGIALTLLSVIIAIIALAIPDIRFRIISLWKRILR